MSKTIDEKVVSMQFDNRNFESNVKTSLGTIERLKQSLNFSGQAKGLEEINTSVKKINVSPLSQGLEKVKNQFSALEVVGITALANITNSAVNTGKRMISALTIDPVKTGFNEYETQINAVQTILANTQHEGTNLEQVNAALDELNLYADKTIYNFTEMTRNIGTFTAAGVKLQTSVDSIKGIANLAAVSGSTSQQASTAMYQLSQALAAGKVSLMDWNSVVNAGMGGKVFQDALVRTSELLGTGAKNAIKMYGSFRESLTKGEWLTTEVLTETLKQFAGAYTEADLVQQGFSKSQAKEIANMAKTAEEAATKVKTFTQLWDTMKESAQSGWTQTWEIIIGDYEEAKELLTGISDWFGKKIQAASDKRNNLLESALGGGESKWSDFEKRLKDAGVSTDTFQNKLEETAKKSGIALDSIIEKEGSLAKAFSSGKLSTSLIVDALKALDEGAKTSVKSTEKMTDKLEYFQKVVDDVWGGKYKNAPERQKLLADAGYEYAEVQALVNKTVDGHRLTLEDLSDAQLKSVGYTEQEIKKIHELATEAEKAGTPLNKLIDSLDRKSGRELLWDSVKNVVLAIEKPLTAIQKAWSKVFSPLNADQVYNFVSALELFTEKIIINEENIPKLEKTFEGLFTIVKFFTTFIGGSARIAFKVFNGLLGLFDLNILDVTAGIGDAIVRFKDWMDTNNFINKGLNKVVDGIKNVAKNVKDWFLAFKDLPIVKENLERLKESASKTFSSLKDHFGETGERLWDFISSLKDLDGISLSNIGKVLSDFKDKVINYFFDAGDKFSDLGKSIQDFANAIFNNMGPVGEFLENVKNKLIDIYNFISGKLSTVDTGSLLSFGITTGVLILVAKLAGLLKTILIDLPLQAKSLIDRAVQPFALIQQSIAQIAKSFSTYLKAQAIKSIATAIAILAGSVFLLAQLDPVKLWNAVTAITALMGFMAALVKVSGDYGPDKGVDFGKMAVSILAIGGSVLLIAIALKQIESIDPDKATQAFGGLAGIIGALIAVVVAYGKFVNTPSAQESIDNAGNLMLKMSASLIIMAYAMKMIASMNPEDITKGLITIGGLSAIITGLIAATTLAGKRVRFVGQTILQISVAIGLLVLVMKMIASMNPEDIGKGLLTIAGLEALIAGLVAITNLAGRRIKYIGSMLIKMSIAMGLMAGVIKLISFLSPSEIAKGITVMGMFELLFAGMIGITRLAGNNPAKIGGTLLAMSAAIAILAGTAVILGMISIKNLAKGIVAIELLSVAMATMIKASRGANDVKSSLIVMTVAIAVMAASIAALSFIEPTKLIASASALGGVMAAFSLMLNQLKNVKFSAKDLASLGALVGVTALLAVIIGAMSSFEYQSSTLENATALSVLLLAMSGVIFVLDKIGKVGKDVFIGIAALTAMAIPLIAFVGVLAVMQYVNKATENVMALTVLSTALTLLLIPLSLVGVLMAATGGLSALGIAALLAMAIPLIAFVGVLAVMQYVNKATENTKLLTDLMTVMADTLVKISIVGPLALVGVTALGALTALMIALGALATGIGALAEAWPDFEKFLDKGIPILEKLAYGLGSVIGSFVSGLANGLMQTLPALGKALSDFMINLIPFVTLSKMVDDKVAVGAGILVTAILALSVADFINSVLSFLSFGSSFADLGTELSKFMVNLLPFIMGLDFIDPNAISAVESLAKTILILTAADLLDNISGFFRIFGGQNPIEKFAANITTLGDGLSGFVKNAGTLGDDEVKTASKAAEIIKILAEASKSIPNSGGVAGFIFGENDLSTWGPYLEELATDIKTFAEAASGITDDHVSGAKRVAEIIKALAEAADTIPNEGGLWGSIFGDNSISAFGSDLPALGRHIKSFGEYVSSVTEDHVNGAKRVADVIKTLADAANTIPNEGGLWGSIFGDNSISKFSGDLPQLGKDLNGFAKEITGFDPSAQSSIRTCVYAIKLLSEAADNFSTSANSLNSIGYYLPTFGTNMSSFADSISDITNMTRVKSIMDDLVGILYSLEPYVSIDLEGLGNKLKTFAETGVRQFANAFSSSESKTLVRDAVKAMLKAASDAVYDTTSYNKFRQAGIKVVNGFAIGISSNRRVAIDAASRLGYSSIRGLENSIESHSPSKASYKRGEYFGQGYINAIKDEAKRSYYAGYNMGDESKKGLSNAIRKIQQIMSNDIDYQPTIQPVLDLSEIQNGASYINGMLAFNPRVGLLSDLNGINLAVDSNNRFDNSDVISAIKNLGKDIGKIQTNQYNIGGVSYSDNKEVSDAISVLVRAAKIGDRR